MRASIGCLLLRPFKEQSVWARNFGRFGLGSWAERTLGPWAILLIHSPRTKWDWIRRGCTLGPPWFVLSSREWIKELERQRLPNKLNRCILGGFRDPLMHFSKGALPLTSWFSRHHYLSIHEPRCVCRLPLVSVRFFASLLLINPYYFSLTDAHSSLASINAHFKSFSHFFTLPFLKFLSVEHSLAHLFTNPESTSPLEPKVSLLPLSLALISFLQVPPNS